jgi:hypothetical protein
MNIKSKCIIKEISNRWWWYEYAEKVIEENYIEK